MPLLIGDAGQTLASLLVAAVLFLVVVAVCAFLLAVFQRVLSGGPSTPEAEPPAEAEATGGESCDETGGAESLEGLPGEPPPRPSGDLRGGDS